MLPCVWTRFGSSPSWCIANGSAGPRCEVHPLRVAAAKATKSERKQDYEQALADFERKNFRITARTLGNLRGEYPDDGPALVLLSRAVNCMVDEPDPFDPVWELPGK